MKIEELREIFSEDGLYAVRVENGDVIYTTLIPDDHVILSIEAFIEYPKGSVSRWFGNEL